uniref:Uncharacterized protein n=1 Tax=Oryza rufipogon TaxID=4529 RepID=A0A0E0QQH7_ORYRU
MIKVHPAVNFNCSVLSASSARILHGTRTDSSPPPAFAAVVSNGKSHRIFSALLPELIDPDLALVTMIIVIVLADRAADQGKKKKKKTKTGRVRLSPAAMALLIVLLLIAVAATGCAAADARGSRCSNDPNLPRKLRMCGPPSSIEPQN